MNTNAKQLIEKFSTEYYLSKEEISYRFPNNLALGEFWQEVVKFRKQKSEILPFNDQTGQNFWYLLTQGFCL